MQNNNCPACPRCGGASEVRTYENDGEALHSATCGPCILGSPWFPTKAEAIEWWSKSWAPAPPHDIEERATAFADSYISELSDRKAQRIQLMVAFASSETSELRGILAEMVEALKCQDFAAERGIMFNQHRYEEALAKAKAVLGGGE